MSQLISKSDIERSKKEEKFVLLTAEQVRKDFAMFGMEVRFSGDVTFAYEELFNQLKVYIDDLMSSDSDKLMSLLYQIDLSEKELAKNDPNVQFETVPELVTHKILERELKKVLIRTYFKEKGQS
jgi:hypothetical protein